jgi:hypothetical protein
LRSLKSSRSHEDEGEIETVSGEILSESEHTASIDTLRAAGVARVLLGSFEEGVRQLEHV